MPVPEDIADRVALALDENKEPTVVKLRRVYGRNLDEPKEELPVTRRTSSIVPDMPMAYEWMSKAYDWICAFTIRFMTYAMFIVMIDRVVSIMAEHEVTFDDASKEQLCKALQQWAKEKLKT